MVPERYGANDPEKYVFDGCLVAGLSPASNLCMNMGYQGASMDFAVASGQMATRRPMRALGGRRRQRLSSYKEEAWKLLQIIRTCAPSPVAARHGGLGPHVHR